MTPPASSDSVAALPTSGRGPRVQVATRAWAVLIALLLFSVAAPLNQFKVPPILPVLMQALSLPVGRAGLIMSVYALTGLILALPAGLIFQRLGYRVTALLAGGSLAIGAALGALSASANGLLATRVIEGVGTSFIAVMAPAVIAAWFTQRRRGAAMGIWAIWVPIGSLTMLAVGPTLAETAGWRAVWWFGAIYAAITTVIFLVVAKPAPQRDNEVATAPAAPPLKLVLRNRNVWLLGVTFAFFNAAVIAQATFMPTYLNLQRGVPLRQAALMVALVNGVSLFSVPMGGVLSDRVGSRRRVYLVGFLALAAILPLMGFLPTAALPFWIALQGLFGGLVPPNVFSAGVEAAGDTRLGGMAMGVLQAGQNAGMLVGPILFGGLVESPGGWHIAFASLAVLSLLGALAGWLVSEP